MNSLLGALRPFLAAILSVLGLAFLVIAAYTFTVCVGLVATGLALLVLGWYFESAGGSR